MTHWRPAYVGVGSNLGDPGAQVRAAIDRLAALPTTRHLLRAPLYRTAPFGPVAQAEFTNSAAGFLTSLDAHALLEALRAIERELGREPARVRWGPRMIDLDLLVLGRERISDAQLTLPHPGIAERAFVLVPLAAIAPTLDVPGVGRVSSLLARLPAGGVEALP